MGGVWNRSHGLNKLLSTSIRRILESFKNDRMLIANATVKKIGLQGLFIEDNNKPLRECMVTPWGPRPNRFLLNRSNREYINYR